jgi:hypothetical protein
MPALVRGIWSGLVATALVMAALTSAHAKTRQQIVIENSIKNRPMVFFLAKGEADACGPGCREWIAAEGVFDPGAGSRFKTFVDGLKRPELPVFFNSSGGNIGQSAIVGVELRKNRTRVGVARTLTDVCRRARASQDECHHLMQAKPEHAARLSAEGAQCYSSCVYAFLGGSTRQVQRGAKLGIHTAFTFDNVGDSRSRQVELDKTHNSLKRYVVQMGADGALIDAAAKISSTHIRILKPDELVRFGVETRGQFETPWQVYRDAPERFSIIKALTQRTASTPPQFLTNALRITCTLTGGPAFLMYRHELPAGSPETSKLLRASFGDVSLLLGFREVKDAVETGMVAAAPAMLDKAAAAPSLTVTETLFVQGGSESRLQELKLSTAGLPAALSELRRQCGMADLVAPAGSASRP